LPKKIFPAPLVPLITGSSPKCFVNVETIGKAPLKQNPFASLVLSVRHSRGQLLHSVKIFSAFSALFNSSPVFKSSIYDGLINSPINNSKFKQIIIYSCVLNNIKNIILDI